MPVENELKYVVNKSLEANMYVDSVEIRQGYLTKNPTSRVRHIREVVRNEFKFSGYFNTYKFTFKHFVNDELLEIETDISQEDFDKLWPSTFNQVRKHRYSLGFNDEKWDIDFFKDQAHNTYFALAEVEMPVGRTKPNFIPDIIKKKMIYRVGRVWAKDFSNVKLSDIEAATKLYNQLYEEYKIARSEHEDALHQTY